MYLHTIKDKNSNGNLLKLNVKTNDKRSGDVLVSRFLVSRGRPCKPAFFITIRTDYIDTGGAVSPLQRVVPTRQLTAHAEKEFPLKKSGFPLALP